MALGAGGHTGRCGCACCVQAREAVDGSGIDGSMLALPTANSVPLTGYALADGLLQSSSWNVAASGNQITYRIFDSYDGTWTTSREDAIDRAFAAYDSVIDVDFVNAGHTGTSSVFSDGVSPIYLNNSYDISIVIYDLYYLYGLGVAGVGYFPTPAYATASWPTRPGDVLLDYRFLSNTMLSDGAFGVSLMLHEIGHAVGLKHPHDGGAAGRPTFSDLGMGSMDNDHHTVMTYNETSSSNYSGQAATLMPLDILSLQEIYGPNTSTNTGDTTYTITDNNRLQTIWDAGGTDTLNFSGIGQALTINMEPGQLTQIGTYTGYALAYNMLIENAVGTAYADTIRGNSADNTMTGGGGGDNLQGGGVYGWHGAVYGGSEAVGDTFNGVENVIGSGFNDSLTGDDNVNRLEGGGGADVLNGRGGADVLLGGAGNDLLVGGAGNDTFDFRGLDGADTVHDFEAGSGAGDQAQLLLSDFASFAAVQGAMTASGGGTMLSFGGGNSIQFQGLSSTDFAADDFLLL